MRRIHADFNTLNAEPVDLVKLGAPGSWQEAELPPLTTGERVILYDSDGLEVEATIQRDAAGWWMASPDPTSWRDTTPQSASKSITAIMDESA